MSLAKTTRPRTIGAYPRARLFRLLDRGRHHAVTWVCGPPGAGKTTLVASYLAVRRLRTLWYQVDPIDADVATFFYYLGHAAPRRSKPLPLLTSEYRQALSAFTRRYFRELCGRLKAPFALVFDNYHEAPTDCPLHEVLREAVAEIPPGGRIIISSRVAPPPAFGRARAHRELTLIEGPDLRFTPAEAIQFSRQHSPRRWSPRTIRSFHQSADGWAAGLVLLLEQSQLEGAQPGTGQHVSQVLFDYFAGEIFSQADPMTREVLLQTAFLPSVSVRMAEALTGRPSVRSVLEDLYRRNYFINLIGRPARGESVYRYHPLLREFLLVEARRTFPASRLAQIHRTAADLLEAAGQVEPAVDLLRGADESDGLGRLICRHAPALVTQGRVQLLREWLDHVPETTFDANPWLRYWRGMCQLGWRHEECRRDLERALERFRIGKDVAGTYLTLSALVHADLLAGRGDSFDRWIAYFDEIQREAPEFPSIDVEAQVALAMLTLVIWRQPAHPAAAHWVARALDLTRRLPNSIFRVGAIARCCFYCLELGDFAKVRLLADEMRLVSQSGDASPVAAMTAAVAVGLYEFMFALPSYQETVCAALDLDPTVGVLDTTRHTLLNIGLINALSRGHLAIAAPWLQEIARELPTLGPGFACWYHMCRVWEALLRGDVSRATLHQPAMVECALAEGWPLDEAMAHLFSAQVLHASGSERTAREHAERGLGVARAIRSPHLEFVGHLVLAQLHDASADEVEGVTALRQALAIGRQHNYVNAFGWQPAVMAQICARALKEGIEPEYVRGLIRTRCLVPDRAPAEAEAWPWRVKIFTLGRFVLLIDDEPLRGSRKVQRKPLALLQALIALGGRAVREERLMDALWPDSSGDSAHFSLTSAIHRLRRMLGHPEAIVRNADEISLDARYCWVDVWVVENLLDEADAQSSRIPGADQTPEKPAELTAQAARLYRGPFLDGTPDIAWAMPLADRLRRRLVQTLVQVGRRWDVVDRWDKAADCYEEAVRVDPCAEDVYRLLMTTDHRLGRPTEVQTTYRRCREALTHQLGTLPSAETEALLRRLQAK